GKDFACSAARCSRQMAHRIKFLHSDVYWNPARSFHCSKRKCREKGSALRAAISSRNGSTVHRTFGSGAAKMLGAAKVRAGCGSTRWMETTDHPSNVLMM